MSAPDAEAVADMAALLRETRWGALATADAQGAPLASQVAFAPMPDRAALLLHLSELAAHTRNLLARPACSLSVSERDDGRADPQTLARLTLGGSATVVARGTPDHEAARDAYLARLPEAADRFGFGDFHLVRVDVVSGHYVGGFARAFRVGDSALTGIIMAASVA